MELVKATDNHIQELLAGLRQSDKAELYALNPAADLKAALQASVQAAPLAWAMLLHGRAVALTGVCANAGGSGAPWLVGTDKLQEVPLSFVRSGRRALASYQALFPRLENYVLASQIKSLRYILALGFKLEGLHRIGAGEFYKFSME